MQRTVRTLVLGFAAIALISGCKGKQTQSDADAPLAAGVSSQGVDSNAMSFEASGSDSGKINGLQSVNFELDKSLLSAESKTKIKGNVDWLKKNASTKLQIEGHCDARGSDEYNIALGERRANAVKSYMTSLGVASARLSIISYGKSKPLVQGDDESAYSKNRRANFVPLQ